MTYFRHMKTTNERRQNDDADLKDFGVKIRAKRKNIPSAYDDINHGRSGRTWKKNRRTKYRPVS